MNIGAPTLLASYAYQQAGGGSAGVSAALASLASSARDVATLVKQSGPGQTYDLLELNKTNALNVATYDLQAAAGKGPQVVQNLLHPPVTYSNPLLTPQTVLNPNVVGAYAKYQYEQAQKAGEVPTFTQQAIGDTAGSAKTLVLYDPIDTNQDGFVSPAETLSYALQNPYLDPKDTNVDGLVSPAEELAYSLGHYAPPSVSAQDGGNSSFYSDPMDINQDGFVSPMEELNYSLKHPGAAAGLARNALHLDLLA